MWQIKEHKNKATKVIKKAPKQVKEKYEFWKQVMKIDGPEGVRAFPGFKDEALKGEWQGSRSSRLNDQYRVIYTICHQEVTVYVEKIGPHDY